MTNERNLPSVNGGNKHSRLSRTWDGFADFMETPGVMGTTIVLGTAAVVGTAAKLAGYGWDGFMGGAAGTVILSGLGVLGVLSARR